MWTSGVLNKPLISYSTFTSLTDRCYFCTNSTAMRFLARKKKSIFLRTGVQKYTSSMFRCFELFLPFSVLINFLQGGDGCEENYWFFTSFFGTHVTFCCYFWYCTLSPPHRFFSSSSSIHLYPSIDAILGAELLWCVVFPAGHVTGLCYLKHDAALGGVGGGVSILQCYRAKNGNGSFMEGEREWCDRLHTVALWMWTAEFPLIPLFNYATLASDAFLSP